MANELDDEDFEFDEDEFDEEVSVEERARAMGWKPERDFKGDRRRFISAEDFVAKGEAELPLARGQNHRMSDKIIKLEREVGDFRNTVAEQAAAIQNAMDLARRADAAGYRRAMDELEAQRREAVSLGDTEAYDQITDQIKAAQTEREAGNVTVPIPQAKPQQAPETAAFLAENPWFNEDAILRRNMIEAHQDIMEKYPNVPLAQQYEMAKKVVADHFPKFFPKAAAPTPVQEEEEEEEMAEAPRPRPRLRAQPLAPTAGANGRGPAGRSPFERITDPEDRAEAKAAFARIAQFDPHTSADEYVTLYLNPKTDILALRAKRGRTIQ